MAVFAAARSTFSACRVSPTSSHAATVRVRISRRKRTAADSMRAALIPVRLDMNAHHFCTAPFDSRAAADTKAIRRCPYSTRLRTTLRCKAAHVRAIRRAIHAFSHSAKCAHRTSAHRSSSRQCRKARALFSMRRSAR
eukprot:scaffold15475_cov31-Tisochrysis_lutea.AAC.4